MTTKTIIKVTETSRGGEEMVEAIITKKSFGKIVNIEETNNRHYVEIFDTKGNIRTENGELRNDEDGEIKKDDYETEEIEANGYSQGEYKSFIFLYKKEDRKELIDDGFFEEIKRLKKIFTISNRNILVTIKKTKKINGEIRKNKKIIDCFTTTTDKGRLEEEDKKNIIENIPDEYKKNIKRIGLEQ